MIEINLFHLLAIATFSFSAGMMVALLMFLRRGD